jgi:exodeoxyribonuclease-3
MRIVSWNVNGLRACAKKGFPRFLAESKADVVGLQEVRALPEQLDAATCVPDGWHACFAPAERPGYSGVAIYSRAEPDEVEIGLGEPRFDAEGRLVAARFGSTFVVNGYFPKGSGKNRDNSRVPYKLEFYAAVFERVQQLRARGDVFVMGDFNTAHEEIDLARPKQNVDNSGFLPEERAELSRWIDAGWVDTFRARHPGEGEHYTWWRQWGGARERNVGWRIDYVFASPEADARVTEAFIWPDVTGSDHCPVGVDVTSAQEEPEAQEAPARRAGRAAQIGPTSRRGSAKRAGSAARPRPASSPRKRAG